MSGPSAHMTWQDVACRDGTPYPFDWRGTRLSILCAEFEAIRALCGDGPLLVNSGYRTPKWNKKVGGAPSSQHCEGRALDIVPVLCSLEQLYQAAKERARVGAVRGIGRYAGFVHIDIRPGDVVAEWGAGEGQ